MTLRDEVAAWDGKSAATIGSIYERFAEQPEFVRSLVAMVPDPTLQSGATWLLKKFLESGGEIGRRETSRLWSALPSCERWEGKVHLLQSISRLNIAARDKLAVEAFIRRCLADTNKFVRAWAYSGFYELAATHREYREEANELLHAGLSEEAASVRARIRRLMHEREPLE